MSGVFDHLRKVAERQARQEQACQRVEEWTASVMEQARGIGAMHREHGQRVE